MRLALIIRLTIGKAYYENTFRVFHHSLAYILGSLASGIIMTVGKGTNSFLITAALFILTSFLFSQIRTNRKVTKTQNIKIKANIWQAVHYIFKQKNTLHITLLTTIWNMLMWGSLPIILPVFVKTSLHATSTTYGLLNAMSSVGIIVGSIFAVSLGNRRTSLQIVTYSVLIQGALYSGLGFSQRPFIFATVLIVTGLVSSSTMIYKTTYYQEEVSKEMQGRVLILINALGSVTYPLGNFITAGLLSMHMNSNLLFIVSGLMITMSALVSLILMRKI
ncbi:MFS transporter [Lacticaseibacillus rhamnosus]|uniref:MFS transporter n=1 Tax=Lacticaseibacillus rhamnosus TaxID=47715 RepID=UPI00128F47ED|nr:MFS transporter [Lacticaseibacillus rhamnosus]